MLYNYKLTNQRTNYNLLSRNAAASLLLPVSMCVCISAATTTSEPDLINSIPAPLSSIAVPTGEAAAPSPALMSPGSYSTGPSADNYTGIPFFPGKDKITVCTSEWTPAVLCAGLDPDEWNGYEFELFRALMPLMG